MKLKQLHEKLSDKCVENIVYYNPLFVGLNNTKSIHIFIQYDGNKWQVWSGHDNKNEIEETFDSEEEVITWVENNDRIKTL